MSSKRILSTASFIVGVIFTFSVVAIAQQPETAPQDNGQRNERPDRMGRHGMGKRGGALRLLSQLNLTEAQQQQMRAIEERFGASTKSQRGELLNLRESTEVTPSAETDARRQELRAEIGQAMRARHQEMLNVLTDEQRTQFEQLVKERKARHGERRVRKMDQQNNDEQ